MPTIIKSLSIIVPAYNEEATIVSMLTNLMQVELINDVKKEVIIIDDGSTDHTCEKVREIISLHPDGEIILVQQHKNSGKGAAIHAGIEASKGDYVVVQDADLEYDPNEFNRLLEPVFKADADVVYGSRFMGSQPHRILFFWHSVGNKILTQLSNALTNLNLTDMETCYKMVRGEIIRDLKLKEKRFGFEPEITAKLAKVKDIKIYEVGISYYGRTYKEGKKINWKDGFRAIYCILKYNLF